MTPNITHIEEREDGLTIIHDDGEWPFCLAFEKIPEGDPDFVPVDEQDSGSVKVVT